MLLDILGILLGFVGIMALLSVVVTSVVQVLQSVFRMRGRALRGGIQRLFGEAGLEAAGPAYKLADDVLQRRLIRPPRSRSMARVAGPSCPEIEREALIDITSGLTAEPRTLASVDAGYEPMIQDVARRFQFRVRLLTVGVALLIAVAFQVSTPALLAKLSTDPEIRAKAIALAEDLRSEAEGEDGAPEPRFALARGLRPSLADEAIRKVAADFPDLATGLEEFSGAGPRLEDDLAEISLILSDANASDRRKAVTAAYERYFLELDAKRTEEALRDMGLASDMLAPLGISLWSQGDSFYVDQAGSLDARNVAGVLITGVLLSLGAPFWFEQLKTIARLRDVLRTPARRAADDSPQMTGDAVRQ
ncbi:MAG: hypothetical protein ACQGVC_04185 [Myxococcota bacterium]